VHLYKPRSDRSSCDNHRGISLLSIPIKILVRVLLHRLQDHVSNINILPKSVRFSCWQRHSRHDHCITPTARKMCRAI